MLFILPTTCLLCGFQLDYQLFSRRQHNICAPCRQNLPYLSPGCQRCAHTLSAREDTLCAQCFDKPPPFEQVHALFPYEPPIIRLITGLKFQRKLANAALLSSLLLQKIRQDWYLDKPLPDLILPVPLHTQRLRERGFNQAVEIAKPISRALRLPLGLHQLTRIKATAAQSTLSAPERAENLSQAFTANQALTGLTIALVDDVITTTATITACCQALKKSGSTRIEVWCIARAMVNMAPIPI